MASSDPSPYSHEEMLRAYGMAHAAGDQGAMTELHQMLLKADATRNAPAADPTTGMSTWDKLSAGAGHGADRMLHGAENLAGLRSDQDLKNEDQTSKPLLNTTAGKIGDVAGQIGATLPLGMGAGAAVKGAGALLKAGATTLAPRAQVLLNALKGASAVGQGAAQGATMADPDEQSTGAAVGGALGGIGANVAHAGGRLVKGLVEKSSDAENLIQDAAAHGRNLFLPISQAAAQGGISGAAKAIYQKALPYALGVKGRLADQSSKADQVMRDTVADVGMADQKDASGKTVTPKAPIGNTTEQTAAGVKSWYDKAYDDKLKGYAFQTPQDFHQRVLDNLSTDHPELPESQAQLIASTLDRRMQEYSKKGQITGGNLQEAMGAARDDLGALVNNNQLRNPRANESGLNSFKDVIQDTIDEHRDIAATTKDPATIKQANGVADDLENYQALSPGWKEAQAGIKSSEGAGLNRGDYTWPDLYKHSAEGSQTQKIAQSAHAVLDQDPGAVDPSGRYFLHGVESTVGGAAAGAAMFGHPEAGAIGGGALLAANAIPHALVNKGTQNALYGDLGMQQAMARLLRQNPNAASDLATAGRSALVAQGDDDAP